jgi:hypothetical protein
LGCTYYNGAYYSYTCNSPTCSNCNQGFPAISGQLGFANIYYYDTPQAVSSTQKFIQVSCGLMHTIALTVNGTIYSWGDNTYGQLGEGSYNTIELTPITTGATTEFGGLFVTKRASMVAAGHYHSLILGVYGELYTVGSALAGEIGDGSTQFKRLPRQISAALYAQPITQLSAGVKTSYVVGADGTLYVWGDNSVGQLGMGNSGNQLLTPTQQSTFLNVTSVSAGVWYTSATVITSSTDTYGWGQNVNAVLGDGTTTAHLSPTKMAYNYTTSYVIDIAPGQNHIAFLVSSSYYCFNIAADDPSVCSYHGTCLAQDSCSCINGFTGSNCNTPICFNISGASNNSCSSNGVCAYTDTCNCYPGYFGAQCDDHHSDFLFTVGQNANYELADAVLLLTNAFRTVPSQAAQFYKQTFQFVSAGNGYSLAFNTISKYTYGVSF